LFSSNHHLSIVLSCVVFPVIDRFFFFFWGVQNETKREDEDVGGEDPSMGFKGCVQEGRRGCAGDEGVSGWFGMGT
jgi:hypothetical protein